MPKDRIVEELLFRHRRARQALRHWAARDATGAPLIRVFVPGTKPALLAQLVRLPIDELSALRSKVGFERWYESQLRKVARTLRKSNQRNPRVQPGIMWGHGAKVLSIYIRSLVLHSRYFPDRIASRVKPWLFVPVDSLFIEKLKSCGVKPPYSRIKDIATRRDFYFAQNLLAERCPPRVSRVVFDDSWADRS